MNYCKSFFSIASCGLLLIINTGCNPTAAVDALQAGLNTLVQNKSLAEQFVRDIKTSVDPSDPAYAQNMENYEQARDAYNHFLDGVELAAKTNQPHPNLTASTEDAQNSAADFLEGATRALRPTTDTRRIPFRRAVTIPETLPKDLNELPKKTRESLIARFDREVRWRPWRQL